MYGRLSVCNEAVAVIDGTHCPIQTPSEYNYTYYSGYKHDHTQNWLCCVDFFGMILYVDGPYPGRPNDREVFERSDLYQNHDKYLSGDECILADGGFVEGPGFLVPIHKTTFDSQTSEETKEEMTHLNTEFVGMQCVTTESVFTCE